MGQEDWTLPRGDAPTRMVLLMIRFTTGNLLEASADALVNTVNEVGVMGKGIALMFKEAFPENYRVYERACKQGQVRVGHILAVKCGEDRRPQWIVNFPTKKHWRNPSQIQWVRDGLEDLKQWAHASKVQSIAVPPLGCGNGGLDWNDVKGLIEQLLGDLEGIDIQVYTPTEIYQSQPKAAVIRKLTPARAMVAEMIRRYGVLGFECSFLEIQKLAWFIQRGLAVSRADNPLKLKFEANRYGPYSDPLRHVLDGLDGSFLHSDKRIADAAPHDIVRFAEEKEDELEAYLQEPRMRKFGEALSWTQCVIEGFESPFGLELLATVDWLVQSGRATATLDSVRDALQNWPHSVSAAKRKMQLFDDRVLAIAVDRISEANTYEGSQRSLTLTDFGA